MIDWEVVSPLLALATAGGAVLGTAFAAGMKNRDIQANTSKIIEVQREMKSLIDEVHKDAVEIRRENDARYQTTVGDFKSITADHSAFKEKVAREYVGKEDLGAMEKRIRSDFDRLGERFDRAFQGAAANGNH